MSHLSGLFKILALTIFITTTTLIAHSAYASGHIPPCTNEGDLIENPEIFKLIHEKGIYYLTLKVSSAAEIDAIDIFPALVNGEDVTIDDCVEIDGTWNCEYEGVEDGFEGIIVADLLRDADNETGKCIVAWVKGILHNPETERPYSENFDYIEGDIDSEIQQIDNLSGHSSELNGSSPVGEELEVVNQSDLSDEELVDPLIAEESQPENNAEMATSPLVVTAELMAPKGGGSCSLNPNPGLNAVSLILFGLLVIPPTIARRFRLI